MSVIIRILQDDVSDYRVVVLSAKSEVLLSESRFYGMFAKEFAEEFAKTVASKF